MAVMNIIEAVRSALQTQMRVDARVVVLGEDVGKFGGVFRATSGLYDEFGADRVIDTPLAEAGIIGTAIGMALYGLRPVPEIQFSDFIFPAFDQIVNELAKFRYRSGGQYPCPVVIRTPVGGGIRGGHYHSQSPEALFIHVPGLKVVCPSNPVDAKGLLATCIRGEDPVIFMEPKRVYRASKARSSDYSSSWASSVDAARRSPARVRHGTIAEELDQGAAASISSRCSICALMPFDLEGSWPRQEDQALRGRPRGAAHVRRRRRADRVDQERAMITSRRADRPGDRVRHAVPVQPRARVFTQRRSRAGRDPPDAGVVRWLSTSICPTSARGSSRARSSPGR
jgi:2-oxoisovalerate dehydrogenase E1 component beta subunit